MIEAGTREQISWGEGNWVFLDIGFSATRPSSGLLIGDAEPINKTYSAATGLVVQHITSVASPTNLVIEAPLSVCFNSNDNPTGRKIERDASDGKLTTRYWHAGLGCTVMVAAMYLIRAIAEAAPKRDVRLFEGFVTYKKRGENSDHRLDVRLLREVVMEPIQFANCIMSQDDLLLDKTDKIISSFEVCGMNCGVPAVIQRRIPSVRAEVLQPQRIV
jgi:hypothetical protein